MTVIAKNNFKNIRILGFLCLLIWSGFTPSFNHNQNPNTTLSIETTDHVIVIKNNTVIFDYLEQADTKDPVQIRVIETPKLERSY